MPRRRRRRAYPSDLMDAQWDVIAPMVPDAAPGGRARKADKRELVEAILYLLRAGCAWRLLPHDFPPWQTVYHSSAAGSAQAYGRGFTTRSSWPIARGTGAMPRPQPASSTVRPSGRRIKGGFKRFDAGKKIHGRKRHILTDTDGRLLAVEVHAADVQDRDGAKVVLRRSRNRFPFVEHVYADGGYAGCLVAWAIEDPHRPGNCEASA